MFTHLAGQALDRYQLQELLGEGTLGAVFKAHDPALQRTVAVKVIDLRQLTTPGAAERLLELARLAARLDHPGLVRVHDFGRADPLIYIVMEYLPGGNLHQLLQELRAANQWLLLSEAALLVRQIAVVLDYVNRQGATPRRVRPSDIMLKGEPADGLPYRPVLTDLGLDEALGAQAPAAAQPSPEAAAPPSYAYWSPEQAMGERIDARSQVYSLGVLLYELAVGWQPFPVTSVMEAVRAHTQAEPPPPRSRRADLPLPLEGVILQALAKDPARRYADPGALAQALAEVQPLAEEVEANRIAQTGSAWGVSLLVPFQRGLLAERQAQQPPAEPFEPTQMLNRGRVRVVAPDGTSSWVAVKPRGLTLGRDPNNDIVLTHPGVAAQHARIDFNGREHTITDLNSASGTFLGDGRLLPGIPEIWPPGVPLLVGDTWFHLEPVEAATRSAYFRFNGSVIDASLIKSSPGLGRVGVYVEVPQLSVTPGQKSTAGLVVINQGPDVDRFSISLNGVPGAWIAAPAPPASVQLGPGAYQRLKITLAPPHLAGTRAGRYNLVVHVASQAHPDEVLEATVAVTVAAFSQFQVELSPTNLRVNDLARVTIHNQGNIPETYTISFEDPEDALVFDPPGAHVAVPEGRAAAFDFSPALQRPRLIGGRRAHPFAVRVASPGGQHQHQTAEVISRAFVPPWVPLLLLFMGCLVAGALALAASDWNNRLEATQTAVARLTAAAIAAGDNDGDGLSNADEIRLRTDPLNPDTDGDGLTDGAEVVWGVSPLVADTDGDTLPDGREVNELRTDPRKADTDGDGLADNVDPDPGHPPTPTATPTDTPLPPTATLTVPPPTGTETPLPATATFTPVPPTATGTPVPPTATFTPLPATATFTPIPATTIPPVRPAGTLIFETQRDGTREIYIMNADGSGQAPLTNDGVTASNATNPSWSAGRGQIAYQTDRDGQWDIYVMSADGSGQTRLTDNPAADTNPVWSPDGSRIVFVSDRDGNPELYVMNADGSGETRLTNAPGEDVHPAWSPDSRRLAFETQRDGNREIYVMNADGTGLLRLTNNAAGDGVPTWHPAGTWLVFVSDRDGNPELYLMSADGAGQIRLTNTPAAEGGPAWSPDGGRLAFVSERDGNPEVYVMNVDGTAQTRLTSSPGLDTNPVWAPTGLHLAFVSERDGNPEVYVIAADGSSPLRLTNNSAFDAPLVWK